MVGEDAFVNYIGATAVRTKGGLHQNGKPIVSTWRGEGPHTHF